MAYNFSAEKLGEHDLQTLHGRLSKFQLIEFFPVEAADESLTLGISIPFKAMDEPRFRDELKEAMSYLISEGFQVTDLYTGSAIAADDIADLARRISA
ncbi:hypothetical protein [Blastopirellula marina]|uniref:Uncharacterized protein n=1 Tax=Blastopirellula marina TaxID=124 RepID=A0A2S8F9Y3_9BACT|nr:hypothetical protein [Blastopirellula marina]PQO28978.1 hypothetical protein C5Y98_22460 [Blastopirellula marina]PTL42250.1 hypothetical protein C5Y97_22470 [Blastopirellula marina]